MNLVRTREGEAFDPKTVEDDYQRIYGLKRFSDVEAKVEPTETGVVVVFDVHEQRLINSVGFRGNMQVSTLDLRNAVDVKVGEAIDRFRISVAKRAIESTYREKNFPFAHVEVDEQELTRHGELNFDITEGPLVRVRKVGFVGNNSFTSDRLKDQIRTAYWIWIFRPGTFDPETVDEDKGFFDVRVGRKLVFSPELDEMQVNFVIEEGPRYKIDRISFKGNAGVTEARFREKIKLVEGSYYDYEILQRDIREIVRAYSPYGYIYQPQSDNPEYLRIETKPVFRKDAGKIELVYEISEGKPFQLGRILVKGNYKTQDKVLLREMRVAPGQLYNSAEIADAADRLRSIGYFSSVSVTPIGEQRDVRDLLIEVQEGRTASFNIGAGVNSNGGVAGNLTFEQRNFDIGNWPNNWRDMLSDRAFTGAGQIFRATFEPGTEQTNASLRFVEPYIFDQPYSLSTDFYLRTRFREVYDDRRVGSKIGVGKRFNYIWSGQVYVRGEDVKIYNVETPKSDRAPEIVEAEGHSTLTSVGAVIRRNTLPPGFFPYRGTDTKLEYESFGLIGGDVNFQRITLAFDAFKTVYEDLLDRRTILGLHLDTGYDIGDSPFYERFYGGGIGSVRGFSYRGISPRSGKEDDPIGGDFNLTGSVELGFPLVGDSFRGVVFSDAGTVEPTYKVGTIRSSVGAGIRLTLPFFGQAPLALDFAYPINKAEKDETQFISFSFGLSR
jgi:outer membrane protein insertion porin family